MRFLLLAFFLLSALPASASGWKLTQVAQKGLITSSANMPLIVQCADGRLADPAFRPCPDNDITPDRARPMAERRVSARPAGGMRDGFIERAAQAGEIFEAWYTDPTDRYAHAILGDGIEGGGLAANLSETRRVALKLPSTMVFEDRTPRIVDFDGFGKNRIVTILSHVQKGAAIALFGLVGDDLQMTAQTPFIGRRNRWRNIAGFADFDGDGRMEIAEVVTPHIGGTLNFWTVDKDKLSLAGSLPGFSNHAIGAREQRLSAVGDFNGDGITDIAVPSANRRTLRLIAFEGPARGKKKLVQLAAIPLPGTIDKAIIAHEEGARITITVGLEDGSAFTIHR